MALKNLRNTKVLGVSFPDLKEFPARYPIHQSLEVVKRNNNANSDFVVIIGNVEHSISRVKTIFKILKEKYQRPNHQKHLCEEYESKLICLLGWSEAVRLGQTTWEAKGAEENRSVFIKSFMNKVISAGHDLLNEVEDMKSLKNISANDLFKLVGLFSHPYGVTYRLVDDVEFYHEGEIIDSTES